MLRTRAGYDIGEGRHPATRKAALGAARLGGCAYVLGWLALGVYEIRRIPADGLAVIVVTMVVALCLLILALRLPVAAGILLCVPLALPIGVVTAAFLVSGVFEQPHSLLQALNLGQTSEKALAYGFLVALPFLVGVVFVVFGRDRLRRPQASPSEHPQAIIP